MVGVGEGGGGNLLCTLDETETDDDVPSIKI